jgi:hypothetical protein
MTTQRAAVLFFSFLIGGCEPLFQDGPVHGSFSDGTIYHPPSAGTQADPSVGSACVDPSGFGGRGCYRCAPTTSEQLLAACTSSRFEDFDNSARITGFDPSRPKPPLPASAPALPPFDPGTIDLGPTGAPACAIDAAQNPVMVLGSTGFPMDALAKAMGSAATIFYLEQGSCDGVASMVLNAPKLSGVVLQYDAAGKATACTLAEEHPADIALSSLFAASCGGQSGLADLVTLPGGVEDLLGPVNPVVFAVPATSRERVISAEAAYRVYGFGSGSGVEPWTDEMQVFRRRASSGNQQTVARTLGIPFDALRGRDSNGSSNMLPALLQAPSPDRAIGISSSEIIEPNHDVLKTLAYRHYDQPVGFYPDGDPAALDRRNVRDGHYFMWIPLHALVRTSGGDPIAAANARLDPDGSRRAARDASVKTLAYVMTSREAPPVRSVDLFGAMKRLGDVPQCAMHVSRANEGASLEPFTPQASCDCAFEAAWPGATPAECQPCRDATECSSSRPSCNFGYCEK